ncbi:MAG: hypothetical protein WD065_02505, partial [Planctomycetaceae bacterium]
MDNRHKSLFRWHKSQWWPRLLLTISMTAVGGECRIGRAQDFPDFGDETPANSAIDSAVDLLDEPFSFPEIDAPEVEDLPRPTLDAPVERKIPAPGSNRTRPHGGRNPAAKRYQEFELKNSGANEDGRIPGTAENPVNRPAVQGRVADFTNKTQTTVFVRRPLTPEEKQNVAAALRQSDQLLAAGESAFREGHTSFTEYSKLLDLSLKLKTVSAEILDKPETVARALDVQSALLRAAGRQIASLDQPGAGRWGAEVLLAEVLAADTAIKLAEQQQDRTQKARAESQRAAAAGRLFEQRLRDYGIGLATLQEVTQAARFLLPASSANMEPQEREAMEQALAAYGQLLQTTGETAEGWFESKANMGTNELVSIFMNDGRLHELADIGPDGTGLGPDDEFAELRDFDDLQSRSATRQTPLAYGEVIPNPFETTGETAGVGRIDHVLATQAEVLSLTAQVAQLQGNGALAQNAYTQSFAASGALYQSELELYQNGTASLGDVLQAWMAGQNVRQQWEQSGFEPKQEWTAHQRDALSELAADTADRHDPRGAGTAEMQLMASLGTFEQLSDLRSALQREAAQHAAEHA